MKKVGNLDGPKGWLIDPHKKWAIHFDFKEGSLKQNTADFTIDMWGVFPSGKPMEFKSRRKVTQKESNKINEYLKKRNLSFSTNQKFRIGYSYNNKTSLLF